jgi:hypothetical protein
LRWRLPFREPAASEVYLRWRLPFREPAASAKLHV